MRVQRGTMVRAIMIVLGALLAIGLTGVANAGPDRMHGVVRGVVVIGPSCPGPAQRGATDCAARPIQTTVSVFAANARSADGAPVATVATDRDGQAPQCDGDRRLDGRGPAVRRYRDALSSLIPLATMTDSSCAGLTRASIGKSRVDSA